MLTPFQEAATAAPSRPAHIALEIVRTAEGFESLRPEWNELLSASRSNCVFLTWEWMFTWWEHLAGGRKLAIAALRGDGELLALAPLASKWPQAEFCGSGFVGSDYLDFIVREGWEEAARVAFASHLRAGGSLKLSNLHRRGSFASQVATELEANGWRVCETKTNVCPYIPLSDASWPQYLESLGSQHRYSFNRRWRQLHRGFDVCLETAETAEQTRSFTEIVIAQHNQRWNKRGGSDAFHTAGLVAFHREFTPIAFRRGWLRLFVLRLNGRPAASLYGLFYNRVFYFYQSGFDPEFGKYSVGMVLMGLAIKSAIEAGAREYDFLHGDESYKSHWAREQRELGRLELYPPGLFGLGHSTAISLGRRLKGAVR